MEVQEAKGQWYVKDECTCNEVLPQYAIDGNSNNVVFTTMVNTTPDLEAECCLQGNVGPQGLGGHLGPAGPPGPQGSTGQPGIKGQLVT